MKRLRNITQMKEQTRNTEVQINEEEIGKLPEKEFRIMIVKMIKNLENKMEKMQESTNKDLEELRNIHTETNNTITEIKNTLSSVQFSSVTQSCPTLGNPMNCSTPGLPVHHQLLEFTQTHVHRVSDAIQPSHPLSSPSPPAPNPSQHQSLFQ